MIGNLFSVVELTVQEEDLKSKVPDLRSGGENQDEVNHWV